MDLKQISYILKIAETGNMTEAARRIHISQSALSQSYRHLEQELGLSIFQKSGRSLRLTEDGKFFCEKGGALLREMAAFEEQLKERGAEKRLRLTYYADVSDTCDETTVQYRSFFPDVRLERMDGTADAAIRALKDGTLDLMLTPYPVEDGAVRTECLLDEPVVVLVADSSPIAERPSVRVAELDGETLTLYRHAESLHALFLGFYAKANAAPAQVLQVYNPLLHIKSRTGFIFMPQSTFAAFRARGILAGCSGVPVEDEFCRRRVFLSYGNSTRPSAVRRAFFAYLRTYHRLAGENRRLPEADSFTVTGAYKLGEKR